MRRWSSPLALALVVLAVYAASLRGGFLNYDDDWLIEQNPILHRSEPGALARIWTDLRPETRQALGAEYLPVRDTLMWLEVRLLGVSPQGLRAVSLLLFVAAALLLRAYLRGALGDPVVAELAAWLFALHPVHAESVAWLAGQKDVAALGLVAAALLVYGRRGKQGGTEERRDFAAPGAEASGPPFLPVNPTVPLLVLLAALAKSVAVVTPLLLLCHDALVRRRPRWPIVAASAALAAGALALHLHTGRVVGMFTPWPGGGRLSTAATMGPVWLRYLGESLVPVRLTVRHEVAVHAASELGAWAAYLPLLALGAAAGWAFRRGQRLPAFAWAWFVIPLLPTSMVIAPLQNLMADRYLLLAVLGPCLMVAALVRVALARSRLGAPVVAAVVLGAAALTFARARVFTDSIALWQDAAAKTPASPRAQYQLAMALRDGGRAAPAEAAFRRALAAAHRDDDTGRMAGNNLAALLAAGGRLAEAQRVLRDVVIRFPADPRALGNLAEITARLGEEAEARQLFESLLQRFPAYAAGLRNYQRHFQGDLPGPSDEHSPEPITSPAPSGSQPSPSPPPDR